MSVIRVCDCECHEIYSCCDCGNELRQVERFEDEVDYQTVGDKDICNWCLGVESNPKGCGRWSVTVEQEPGPINSLVQAAYEPLIKYSLAQMMALHKPTPPTRSTTITFRHG